MWVKICGVRDPETARDIVDAGADAIGLNFYPDSKRYVTPSVARQIAAEICDRCEPVGLFVNATIDTISETIAFVGLPTIQLHGDESPEMLVELQQRHPQLRIIRAFRVADQDLNALERSLTQISEAGGELWGCLVDSHVPGSYGGTGVPVAWSMLHREWQTDRWPPLILAGGLTPGNVAQAIRDTAPWGVDTASGVESAPAVKDPELVRKFIYQARQGSC